jgi:quinolinate synthase
MFKHSKDTALVAHFYSPPEVKEMADFVGDSLNLILWAQEHKPKRLIFGAVLFMAETAKVMLPNTEVIIPDINATCSLVTQTDVNALRYWKEQNPNATHIMYINSSVEMKALADVIVTSANVNAIVEAEVAKGNDILFSPDANMGRYINSEFGYDMNVWTSVCEVHDQFNLEALEKDMRGWTDGKKYVLAHPESKLDILNKADFVGSTNKMLQWVIDYPHNHATIWVATEGGLLDDMKKARPELDFRSALGYNGCSCNQCPYMALNTVEAVQAAINGTGGAKIDYLSDEIIEQARKPIERMLEFSK